MITLLYQACGEPAAASGPLSIKWNTGDPQGKYGAHLGYYLLEMPGIVVEGGYSQRDRAFFSVLVYW